MAKPIVLFIELKIASKSKYVCEIAEKLFQNNITLSIFAEAKSAVQIDNLLWTWKQDSFIPHQIYNGSSAGDSPVLICDSADNLSSTQALVLFDPLPMKALTNFNLIIDFAEIYHADKKVQSRQRFKEMRDSSNFDIHFTHLGALLSKKSIDLNGVI